jgi:DNA polymerase
MVFIGEAPGYYEDQQGRPFVGPAGQFLDQLLGSIGLRRQDVYICNVIKCRPPQNQDPLPHQIRACDKWLGSQLELINPRLVATLGRYSLARFLPGQPISRIHGQARRLAELIVVPMYHPAAALHQGSLRKTIEEDFRKLPDFLKAATQEKAPAAASESKQMSLF